MKEFNKDKEYSKGIAGFNEAFSDMYDPQEHKFLKIFGPLAQRIALGDFSTSTPKINNEKSKISDEEIISQVQEFTKKMSPSLYAKINKMLQDGQITFDKQKDMTKDIQTAESSLQFEKNSPFADDEKIKELEEKLEQLKLPVMEDSEYNTETGDLNVDKTLFDDPAAILVHELGHALTADDPETVKNMSDDQARNKSYEEMRETLTITLEILYERMKSGQGEVGFMQQLRLADIKQYAQDISYGYELLNKFEEQGEFTEAQATRIADKENPSREGELSAEDANVGTEVMDGKYFYGTAMAFVLAPRLKTAEDVEKVITILSSKELTPLEKVEKLEITPQAIEQAVEEVFSKIKSLGLSETEEEKQP
ncbi:MAG: hypothetical protein FWE31_00530 [Firmicutes bacterium]|nr:hypothetical protein [Bacillota bacterium]